MIFKSYHPALPQPLLEKVNSGALAIGEVGIAEPQARTKRVGEDQFTVELYSGFMEFYYTITRILCGAQREFRPGEIEQPSLSQEELTHRVADVFKEWQAGRFWNGQRYQHPLFLIQEGQREIAEYLATRAEAFVLAHELGHVMIYSGYWPDEATAKAFPSEETQADVFAINLVLRSAQSGQYRMRYAGIVLAIRVFCLLEKLGFVFPSGKHPLVTHRLKVLKELARELSPNELFYVWMSTIAAAYDEQMEAVENIILGLGPKTSQTAERVAIRLFAMIEEAVKGRLDNLVAQVTPDLAIISDQLLADAVAKLNGWLSDSLGNEAWDGVNGMGLKMRKQLGLLSRDLPPQYAAAFTNAGVSPT